MTARPSILPLAALLLLGLARPVAAQGPEVVKVRFEGASSFTRSELAAAIVTSATTCPPLLCWADIGRDEIYLKAGDIEADEFRLKVYYFERGFREAEIRGDTTRVGDDEVVVTFHVREGRPVRVARVVMLGAPGQLSLRDLPISAGHSFDVVAYEATRDTVLARLRDNGYAHAQILLGYTISGEDPYSAHIQYEVVPGPRTRYGEIRIVGTESVSDELVHRMLAFETGELYNRSELLRSQRNLYGLQIFRHAVVEAAPVSATDTVIPIRVRLTEGDMRRVRLGGGANNVECVNVEGRWTSRNFMGNGRRFSVTGRLGNLLIDQCDVLVDDQYAAYDSLTGVLSVDFNQPWFFGPRNNIGTGLFMERRNVPEVFVRSAAGGYISVGRQLMRGAALTLAYRPELTALSPHQGGDLFFCVNFVGCTIDDVEVLADPHYLSPVTASFTMDRTDGLLVPASGFIVRTDLEHAGPYTLSDFSYTRLLSEGSTYFGEPGGVVLATRLRGGIGWAHAGGAGSATLGLNPQKRFFAGGPNSVRGFDQYRLGPTFLGIDAVPGLVTRDSVGSDRVEGAGCTPEQVNDLTCDASALALASPARFEQRPWGGEVLLEGNVELRFPLPIGGGKVRGAAFVDAGQVWRTRADVALDEIVATPGIGLRYYSPVGPIRIDAAFNTRGTQELRVLTTRVEDCLRGSSGCETVNDPKMTLRNTDTVAPLDMPVRFGSDLREMDSFGDFLRRLNFHFSIGQAF